MQRVDVGVPIAFTLFSLLMYMSRILLVITNLPLRTDAISGCLSSHCNVNAIYSLWNQTLLRWEDLVQHSINEASRDKAI